jgi:hypothetical protein
MDSPKPDFVEIKMDAEIGSYQESEQPVEPPIAHDEGEAPARD